MAIQGSLFLTLLILVSVLACTEPVVATSFNRSNFPADFVFGTASSSYQVGTYFHTRINCNLALFCMNFRMSIFSIEMNVFCLWIFQYEGAVKEDGKGPSISDTFSHKYPGLILG